MLIASLKTSSIEKQFPKDGLDSNCSQIETSRRFLELGDPRWKCGLLVECKWVIGAPSLNPQFPSLSGIKIDWAAMPNEPLGVNLWTQEADSDVLEIDMSVDLLEAVPQSMLSK
ncbi:hypothetical protein V6N13_099275 [Hibiscus sabdariffa]